MDLSKTNSPTSTDELVRKRNEKRTYNLVPQLKAAHPVPTAAHGLAPRPAPVRHNSRIDQESAQSFMEQVFSPENQADASCPPVVEKKSEIDRTHLKNFTLNKQEGSNQKEFSFELENGAFGPMHLTGHVSENGVVRLKLKTSGKLSPSQGKALAAALQVQLGKAIGKTVEVEIASH
ncbi:MAG: hypothetical protein HC848_05370 [Limnobacter sp.]|nr:hypothetical protein [Limnobacter sp.]